MAHDVFISYSSRNTEFAEAVCEKLEDNGIECWIAPRNIKTGTNYAKEIMDGLDLAKMVVLVFSKDAQDSEYVNNEIDTAFSNNKPIVSFKVDDSFPKNKMEFFLKNTQWLDASPSTLKEKNKTLESCYDQLVKDVRRILEKVENGEVFGYEHTPTPVIPHKEKGFFEKYKLPIIGIVLVLIAVTGFMLFSGMGNDSSADETNETGISIGYVGLEDYGDNNYAYFVFGTIDGNLSNSSDDVIHIDYYDDAGKIVDSSDTKIADIEGNILGSIDVTKKDVSKVSVELQDKKGKVLYSLESDNIIEQ
ncbi:toll/interleukin-1 receptor domain-containing protein [Methanobrevibacter sp.]|uniref:toll/interleukin-1 receptor domain-containing protein n=1 Tax=Methanobrevibacter sp. TaxID=66852 RepID=UPI00389085B1